MRPTNFDYSLAERNHIIRSDEHGRKFGFGGGGHNELNDLSNGENGDVKAGHGFVFG